MESIENMMKRFAAVKAIEAGWSEDRKFCVTDRDGAKYLLRVSAPEKADFKRAEFEMMGKAAARGIPMCLPVEFGLCQDGVYSLQSWIDGVDLTEALKTMDAETQYRYGVESGKILRRIQETPVPPAELDESWEDYFNRKTDRRVAAARQSSLDFCGKEEMLDYIERHRHLLKGRERVFQHGDYHVGNLMVDRNGGLKVIDFDRYEFGDPWEEFVRICFDVEVSAVFARGKMDGYFDGRPPAEFWALLAFYLASNEVGDVAWSVKYGDDGVARWVQMAEEICDWFDGMKNPVPKWYREG